MKNLLFFFFSFCSVGIAFASGHHPEIDASTSTGNLIDNIVSAFLSQGITGAMLIVIGFYLYRTENQARDDRVELTRKLEDLVLRSQDNLIDVKSEVAAMKVEIAGIKSELGNNGRELESLRDFLMTNRTK
tara:strand:+ start:1670 stop:2062 length:393 start_codon:yes stop_codon:yes gene_type:complete